MIVGVLCFAQLADSCISQQTWSPHLVTLFDTVQLRGPSPEKKNIQQ